LAILRTRLDKGNLTTSALTTSYHLGGKLVARG
jgi:hypothetical protein